MQFTTKEQRMDNFWTENATALIAECGADFIRTATLEQVVDRADVGFKTMRSNTLSSVLETARAMVADASTQKA
jgi:hypothetical protein